jgi:hypothetical protein
LSQDWSGVTLSHKKVIVAGGETGCLSISPALSGLQGSFVVSAERMAQSKDRCKMETEFACPSEEPVLLANILFVTFGTPHVFIGFALL